MLKFLFTFLRHYFLTLSPNWFIFDLINILHIAVPHPTPGHIKIKVMDLEFSRNKMYSIRRAILSGDSLVFLYNLYIFVWTQHDHLAHTVFALDPSSCVTKRWCFIEGWVVNSIDPDQMPQSAVSDLELHCLLLMILDIYVPRGCKMGLFKFSDKKCKEYLL